MERLLPSYWCLLQDPGERDTFVRMPNIKYVSNYFFMMKKHLTTNYNAVCMTAFLKEVSTVIGRKTFNLVFGVADFITEVLKYRVQILYSIHFDICIIHNKLTHKNKAVHANQIISCF